MNREYNASNGNVEVIDFVDQKLLSHIKIHPENNFAMFIKSEANLEANTYERSLWQIQLETLAVKNVEIECAPDDYFLGNEEVLFLFRGEDFSKLDTYDLKTNKMKDLVILSGKVQDFAFQDHKIFYVKNSSKSGLVNWPEGVAKECSLEEKSVLYFWDLETSTEQRITPNSLVVDHVHFDLKNDLIVFNAFEESTVKPVKSSMYTYKVSTGEIMRWTNRNERIELVANLSSSYLVYLAVNLDDKSRNDNLSYCIIDKTTGEHKSFDHLLTCSIGRPAVVSDHRFNVKESFWVENHCLYHTAVEREREVIRSFEMIVSEHHEKEALLQARTKVIENNLIVINDFAIRNDDIIAVGCLENALQEVYIGKLSINSLIDTKGFGNTSNTCAVALYPLTTYHKHYNQKLSVIEPCSTTIDGWVIRPKPFEPDKKYPGVLFVHGGPKMIYSKAYNHDMEVLAGRGYFVFYANPSGSDGRGDDFSNIRGCFGEKVFLELMAYVSHVCKIYPQIDESRLGVTGGSYGGYMTNYIITRTNRFKAAISERGICDLTSTFLTSDIGYQYVREYMGNGPSPWEASDLYRDASPIHKVNLVKTPTLFNHGSEDIRCHPSESIMMHRGLLFHGIETELCLYKGEGHGFVGGGKPQNRLKRYERVVTWFERFL